MNTTFSGVYIDHYLPLDDSLYRLEELALQDKTVTSVDVRRTIQKRAVGAYAQQYEAYQHQDTGDTQISETTFGLPTKLTKRSARLTNHRVNILDDELAQLNTRAQGETRIRQTALTQGHHQLSSS